MPGCCDMKTLLEQPTKDLFTEEAGFSKGTVVCVLTNTGSRIYGTLSQVRDDDLLLDTPQGIVLQPVPFRTIVGVCPMNGPMSAWNLAPVGAVRMGTVPIQEGSRIAPFVFFLPGYMNTSGWKEATPRPWWA